MLLSLETRAYYISTVMNCMIVRSKVLETKMQSQFTEVNLNILNSGIYIMVLSDENGSLNQKIVKVNQLLLSNPAAIPG